MLQSNLLNIDNKGTEIWDPVRCLIITDSKGTEPSFGITEGLFIIDTKET